MKITEVMLAGLEGIYAYEKQLGEPVNRPTRNPRARTHQALLQRGLIMEANDPRRSTTVTKTGLDLLVYRGLVNLPRPVQDDDDTPSIASDWMHIEGYMPRPASEEGLFDYDTPYEGWPDE